MKKPEEKKVRDYHAMNAIVNRPSAGPIQDERKERDKKKCRDKVNLKKEGW
jgi:hypothetical protein